MTSVLLAGVIGFQGLPADQRTPEATIRSYVRLLQAKEFALAYECIQTKRPMLPGALKIVNDSMKNLSIDILSIEPKISGTTAKALVTASVSRLGYRGSQPKKSETKEMVHLVLDGQLWKIVPPTAGDPRYRNPFLSIMAYVMTVDEAFLERADKSANRFMTVANIKQLAVGLMMYASEHKDRLPTSAAWMVALKKYFKSTSIFRAPGIVKNNPISDYSFNPELSGIPMKRISDPSNTVMVYLGKNRKLNFAYEGKTVVAFADRSAREVSPKEAKKLRWKP